MFEFVTSKRFKKSLKSLSKDEQFYISKLEDVLMRLKRGESLDVHHKNHKLRGEFEGYYECHVQPDVLLIYEIDELNKMIYLFQIGSHSELF